MKSFTPTLKRFFHSCTVAMVFGICTSTGVALAEWTPPIGIPAPPFGIKEVAPALPSPWTQDVPGFYYVREGGTNAGYGYPGSPRDRIPERLPAGSVVILAGVYNARQSNPYNIIASGTASRPVYIRGACCADAPTITDQFKIGGSYYVVENVATKWVDARPQGGLIMEGDHGVLRHTDLRGDKGQYSGYVALGGSYHVIWDNRIHDFGDVKADYDQDNHGIALGEQTDHIWIVDNDIARCSGTGVNLNAGSIAMQPTLHHIYVGRNASHGNKQDGFWSKQAVDVIFSQNTCYDHRPGNSSDGACMGGQYGPSFVWFLFNHIYDSESGIRIQSTSGLGSGTDVFVIGNVIHDITDTWPPSPDNAHGAGAIVFRDLTNHYVVNNTLWNYQAGINVPTFGSVYIAGNILGGRNAAKGRDIFVERNTTAANSVLRNNVFDPSSVRIQWGDDTVYTTLSAFSSATGKGQGSVEANPQFVDAAGKNFQLRATSPAINAGVAEEVYNIFLNRYGLDIRKDVAGTARPQSSAFDIGAYEYVSQVALQPPVPPTVLKVR